MVHVFLSFTNSIPSSAIHITNGKIMESRADFFFLGRKCWAESYALFIDCLNQKILLAIRKCMFIFFSFFSWLIWGSDGASVHVFLPTTFQETSRTSTGTGLERRNLLCLVVTTIVQRPVLLLF